MDKTLYSTKPDTGNRPAKEMKTYELLEKLNIPYLRVDHQPVATVDACTEVEAILGIEICKNLFLCNGSKTEFYLLVMPGHKKFITKDVSRQIGSSRLSFGQAGDMQEYLNVTPGSVSILGLAYDTGHKIHLLMDKETAGSEYIGCHPCINTSSLKIKTMDILHKFLKYTGHDPVMIG
ncbi:MAG: prolyl-tRNA synthetase associated domain-containing protein [Clostridiaceae bacterium]